MAPPKDRKVIPLPRPSVEDEMQRLGMRLMAERGGDKLIYFDRRGRAFDIPMPDFKGSPPRRRDGESEEGYAHRVAGWHTRRQEIWSFIRLLFDVVRDPHPEEETEEQWP